jgi:nucleotide-binding universal stress UspA family protein
VSVSAAILVAVDGSACADRATAHAMRLARTLPGAAVHLLNVQPAVDGLVAMFVPKADVDSYRRDEGAKALASAVGICSAAGVACETHIGVGRPGKIIGQFAKRLGAGQVIAGTRGHGGVAGVLLGSVAQDILAHVDVPITLVK